MTRSEAFRETVDLLVTWLGQGQSGRADRMLAVLGTADVDEEKILDALRALAPYRESLWSYEGFVESVVNEGAAGRLDGPALWRWCSALATAGATLGAVELLYGRVDEACRTGDFAVVDAMLSAAVEIGVAEVDTTVLLGALSITAPAAPHLKHRAAFRVSVREVLTRREPERVERLLYGLG